MFQINSLREIGKASRDLETARLDSLLCANKTAIQYNNGFSCNGRIKDLRPETGTPGLPELG